MLARLARPQSVVYFNMSLRRSARIPAAQVLQDSAAQTIPNSEKSSIRKREATSVKDEVKLKKAKKAKPDASM